MRVVPCCRSRLAAAWSAACRAGGVGCSPARLVAWSCRPCATTASQARRVEQDPAGGPSDAGRRDCARRFSYVQRRAHLGRRLKARQGRGSWDSGTSARCAARFSPGGMRLGPSRRMPEEARRTRLLGHAAGRASWHAGCILIGCPAGTGTNKPPQGGSHHGSTQDQEERGPEAPRARGP